LLLVYKGRKETDGVRKDRLRNKGEKVLILPHTHTSVDTHHSYRTLKSFEREISPPVAKQPCRHTRRFIKK
jgi:hypothetical protein